MILYNVNIFSDGLSSRGHLSKIFSQDVSATTVGAILSEMMFPSTAAEWRLGVTKTSARKFYGNDHGPNVRKNNFNIINGCEIINYLISRYIYPSVLHITKQVKTKIVSHW